MSATSPGPSMPTRSSAARQYAATPRLGAVDVESCGQRRCSDRQDDVDGPFLAWSEAQVVAQHGVGEAVGIADLQRPAGRRCLAEPSPTGRPRPARGERCSAAASAAGAARRSPRGPALPLQGLDRAGTAAMGEELRRRIRLEGPPGEREASVRGRLPWLRTV
jgi:hypothetical protein